MGRSVTSKGVSNILPMFTKYPLLIHSVIRMICNLHVELRIFLNVGNILCFLYFHLVQNAWIRLDPIFLLMIRGIYLAYRECMDFVTLLTIVLLRHPSFRVWMRESWKKTKCLFESIFGFRVVSFLFGVAEFSNNMDALYTVLSYCGVLRRCKRPQVCARVRESFSMQKEPPPPRPVHFIFDLVTVQSTSVLASVRAWETKPHFKLFFISLNLSFVLGRHKANTKGFSDHYRSSWSPDLVSHWPNEWSLDFEIVGDHLKNIFSPAIFLQSVTINPIVDKRIDS